MKKLQAFLGYGKQSMNDEDRQAVLAVLDSDFLTQGPKVREFERAISDYVGAKYAIAVTSGTAALHLACLAADLKAGDLAVTSTLTFVATANAPIYCGARTILLDIDPTSFGLSLKHLSDLLKETPQIKVVLAMHYAGHPVNMDRLRSITGNRIVIEDACHALGAKYQNGNKVGSCSYSDMCVFSFHPIKPITTGEGGIITTNDHRLAQKLRMLRDHGLERNPELFIETPKENIGPWSYEQQLLGYNYRLSDLQAALGISQLTRIDQFLDRRKEIASLYDQHFSLCKIFHPIQNNKAFREHSGHHLYVLHIDFATLGKTKKEVMLELKEKSIGTQVHYIPVHQHPYHKKINPKYNNNYSIAENHYNHALSIPFHPELSNADVERVADEIKKILR